MTEIAIRDEQLSDLIIDMQARLEKAEGSNNKASVCVISFFHFSFTVCCALVVVRFVSFCPVSFSLSSPVLYIC